MKKNFLEDINRQFEERATLKRASKEGLGYVNFKNYILNPDFARVLTKAQALESEAFVLEVKGKKISLAVVEPDLPSTQKLITDLHHNYDTIEIFLCSLSGFEEAMKIYDTEIMSKKVIQENSLEYEKEESLEITPEKIKKWERKILEAPTQTALNDIKSLTVRLRGTDIHFQPFEDFVLLRIRIDGILHDLFKIPYEKASALIMRIKYESGMRSNVSHIPQDGHISYTYHQRRVDLRVSTVPSPFLESVVIRVLDSQKGVRSLEDLGFDDSLKQIMVRSCEKNQGLILVTGPTGSGKTTTLYALLKYINQTERKIVTLEDPIEYHLSGISQSQINEKVGYTFESGFEALLRHDPDVILLGEIRSPKTAHLTSQAALTGHLVLSTLHTNSSIEAISRLRNLEVENFNIGPALKMIVAQRLVRKVKKGHTKPLDFPQDHKPFKRSLEKIKKVFPQFPIPSHIQEAVETPLDSAYEGRMAVAEVLEVTPEIQRMIVQEKSTLDIQNRLENQYQFFTMYDHGILKVLKGETTLQEVDRVLG